MEYLNANSKESLEKIAMKSRALIERLADNASANKKIELCANKIIFRICMFFLELKETKRHAFKKLKNLKCNITNSKVEINLSFVDNELIADDLDGFLSHLLQNFRAYSHNKAFNKEIKSVALDIYREIKIIVYF